MRCDNCADRMVIATVPFRQLVAAGANGIECWVIMRDADPEPIPVWTIHMVKRDTAVYIAKEASIVTSFAYLVARVGICPCRSGPLEFHRPTTSVINGSEFVGGVNG